MISLLGINIDEIINMQNLTIAEQFKLIRLIAKGHKCQIYESVSVKDGKMYAVKLQPQQQSSLLREATIYLDIQENNQIVLDYSISFCYYAGKTAKYNVIAIDYFGTSLQYRLKQCSYFQLKTFAMLADQTLKRVEFLHRKGYIHRNIQPSKFILGRNQTVKRIYLIGLNQAKKWMKDDVHIPYIEGKKIKGNIIYQSINAHLHIELSRRDDMESLVYCWAKFLLGKLPWQDEKQSSKILSKKIQYRPELLFKKFPSELIKIQTLIRALSFNEQPDYDGIRLLLQEILQNQQLEYDYFYDWDEIQLSKNPFTNQKTVQNL